jgi:hypothetical protein
MKFFWQPDIDLWIKENTEPASINNTASFATSYKYAPSEGEEEKNVTITGVGSMTMKELRDKISDILSDLAAAAKDNNIKEYEKIYHRLSTDPGLINMVKECLANMKKGPSYETGTD